MYDDEKDPAAVALGRRGGKAGTGKSKVRGSRAYYQELSRRGIKARRAKAKKAEREARP